MRWGPRRGVAGCVIALALLAATAFAQDLVITGTDGNDVLNGTPAGEAIYAAGGNDIVNAGDGDDDIDGGPGSDILSGGPGQDSVSYGGGSGVVVTLDGLPNDGAPGENDNVFPDVEDVFGTENDDKLTGNAAANTLDGNGGDDKIVGGAGEDTLFGGDGNDFIDSRDGKRDRVECGAGDDNATIDRIDDVSGDCERRNKPPVTITPGLTIIRSKRRLIISSITARSAVVLACVRGCHPRTSPRRAVIRRRSVTLDSGRTVRLRLPGRISGATVELGVTARGAATTCVRYRIGPGFSSLRPLRRVRCTTVARRKP
jgi:Ca2+-binding RTX toxin-like protein